MTVTNLCKAYYLEIYRLFFKIYFEIFPEFWMLHLSYSYKQGRKQDNLQILPKPPNLQS